MESKATKFTSKSETRKSLQEVLEVLVLGRIGRDELPELGRRYQYVRRWPKGEAQPNRHKIRSQFLTY